MEQADIVFLNGDIITIDDSNPMAEALAIKDGKILAVGKTGEVQKCCGKETETIDLGGKTLMPGLIEPHSHPVLSGVFYNWLDVSGFNNVDEVAVMNKIKEAARKAKPGEWIAAFGYDPILIPGLKSLTADMLSEIAPDNPVFIMTQTMHTSYVNHKAFELAGVNRDTPQPGHGSEFVKDENGNLTGMLIESLAAVYFLFAMLSQEIDENTSLVRKQLNRYARAGYTTVGAAGIFPMFDSALDIVMKMVQSDDSPVRMAVYRKLEEMLSFPDMSPGTGDDRFRYIGAKFWYDGSPYTGTMLLDEPYLENEFMQQNLGLSKDNYGSHVLIKEELYEHVKRYHDQGWQVSVHTQGDKAIRETMDVFERVLRENPRDDHRHRLEHCGLFLDDQLERARDLGISPSWHINHIHYYGRELKENIIGQERAEKFMAIGAAVKLGLKNSLHNDSPMYPAEPLKLLRTAVTRKTRKGDIIGADQAISVEEGLKTLTIHAAWQMFMEDKIGSLEKGKLADLVILAENPLKTDPDQLHKIEVVRTYREGKADVYLSPQSE